VAPTSTGYTYNLGLPGQYFDAETGLNYNDNRDFDASTGRYIESDPLGLNGGQWSVYVYSANSPLSLTDPMGLCEADKCKNALKTAKKTSHQVLNAYANWSTIQSAASDAGIDPALLAAIGGGMGAGVFQIDLGANPAVTSAQAYNVTYSANFAAAMLARNMASLAASYPNLDQTQLLQATAASYNFGTGNISGNPNTIDQGTTGNNYGQNVVDLMSCFDY
jgi:RHS repeat-associated protein